nr:sensor histidine kinase [Gluconacetobacter diazotrophicus]
MLAPAAEIRTHDAASAYHEYRTRLVSPLMRRILLVNALPLMLLALTLLYLNQFQNSLLEAEVTALREQARIYAGALGQSAVVSGRGSDPILDAPLARPLLLRLTEPSPAAHARLFAPDGQLVADSRVEQAAVLHRGTRGQIESQPLPSPVAADDGDDRAAGAMANAGFAERFYDRLLSLLPTLSGARIVTLDTPDTDPSVQPVMGADGQSTPEMPPYIRRTANRHLIVTVAEPVMHDGQTIGIIQLTRQARDVDRSLFAVRSSILSLVLIALAITVLLSWYLSLTIARPLLRLAASAHVIRESHGRSDTVPPRLLARRDEIGEVARALQDSARALWARMDAIERFAADVSHEIKNPLSSIRSAIETLVRIEDLNRQRRLLSIINDDVRRLDRLITDISDASRVDAELSRTRTEPVGVVPILSVLAEIHQATRAPGQPILAISVTAADRSLTVQAVEDRLVQVLRNLIGNAISFSPPDGRITLSAVPAAGGMVDIAVADEGPGIPAAKLNSIFDRFYSERPTTENFGQHSGLGLSISRQIVEALKGTIRAENRVGTDGRVVGARFVVTLPRVVG